MIKLLPIVLAVPVALLGVVGLRRMWQAWSRRDALESNDPGYDNTADFLPSFGGSDDSGGDSSDGGD